MHKVYLGDSRDMRDIPGGAGDLVIFDPPLWDHVVYSVGEGQIGNKHDYSEYLADVQKVASEAVRVLKPGGVLVTTVPDMFVIGDGKVLDTISFHHDLYEIFHAFGLHMVSNVTVLIGDDKERDFIPPDENPSRERHDLRTTRVIATQVFAKGDYAEHLQPTVVRDYWQNVVRFGSHSQVLGSRTMYRVVTKMLSWKPLWDVKQTLKTGLGKKYEAVAQTDYPVRASSEFFEWVIASWTRPGDVVIDPFLGTGTTLAICEKLGRMCIGYEISPQAYGVIKQSVSDLSHVEFIGWESVDIQ